MAVLQSHFLFFTEVRNKQPELTKCFIWSPATEEYIHTGSTHQLHIAEYKQKQKGEDQSYLQGTEIPYNSP